MTAVVDASAMVDLLLGVVPEDRVDVMAGDLAVPDLLFVEVASALARLTRRGLLDDATATLLLEELRDAPVDVHSARELVARAFELRSNAGLHDGCYVALAEALGCPLITADGRLARAPGLPVRILAV